MPSTNRGLEGSPSPRVLILCPQQFESDIRHEIVKYSSFDWERRGSIRLCSISADDIANKIDQTNAIRMHSDPPLDLLHVVAFHNIPIRPSSLERLAEHIVWTFRPRSLSAFRSLLPSLLRTLGLDLVGVVLATVGGAWEHGTVDRELVDEWLLQFSKVGGAAGDYRWLGHRLLSVLDFWPASRLVDGLSITPAGVRDFDVICVNNERLGKSASNISNKISKRLASYGARLPVEDFRQTLERGIKQRILFVEDCLMTGNEMTRVLGGLLGEADRFGTPRTSPLSDPSRLRVPLIRIRSAVAANAGYAAVMGFLRSRELGNIEVDVPKDGLLPICSWQGLRAIEAGTECDADDCLLDPDGYVIPQVFERYDVWGSAERREAAVRFCRTIGRQLYRIYLEGREKTVPERWLDEAALGVRGYGLALAFGHSVPKETLPLFWMKGRIEYEGCRTDWIPLFPAAL
jgi:hypothetical protein